MTLPLAGLIHKVKEMDFTVILCVYSVILCATISYKITQSHTEVAQSHTESFDTFFAPKGVRVS